MKPLKIKLLEPLQAFIKTEAASSVVLGCAALTSLLIANSPLYATYTELLHLKWLGLTLHHWVNDGLMTIFFFVVGLEIKKELALGELSTPQKAALPLFAALGGMVAPALIYLAFNQEGALTKGWGIPMATDIAFAVGVLTLFGRRVPLALKIFLLALAIVDDLGAVLIIAIFYTKEIHLLSLALAALGLLVIAGMRFARLRPYPFYFFIGALIWLAFLSSGVHATVAGVLLGLMTPVTISVRRDWLPLRRNQAGPSENDDILVSPLDSLLHSLHPYVSFGIMPIFALANSGVRLDLASIGETLSHTLFQGISLGLFIGKPVGIMATCLLAVSLGWAQKPKSLNWSHLLGASCLAGIGFTMSIFISSLALPEEFSNLSKTGIIMGSLASGLVGATLLWLFLSRDPQRQTGEAE